MDANVSTMTMPKTMPVQNLLRYISFKRPSINYVVSKSMIFDPLTPSLLSFYYIKSVISALMVKWCVYLCTVWSINNEAAAAGFQQNWPNQRYFHQFYKQQSTGNTIDLVFFPETLAAISLRDHMVNFKNWNLEAIFC